MDNNWLLSNLPTLLKTVGSALLFFVVLLVIIRFYGLRSFAKMSSVDFASTVAIGSIMASVTMNSSSSVVQGGVAVITLLGFQQIFSYVKRKSDTAEAYLENSPVFLMRNGVILEENLTRTGVTRADLMAKLREANVLSLKNVRAVVFETTGDVAVLHATDDTEVDAEILHDVQSLSSDS